MNYPNIPDWEQTLGYMKEYVRLKAEYGAKDLDVYVEKTLATLKNCLEEVKAIPIDETMKAKEPDELEAIKALRPEGPRRMWDKLSEEEYRDKLEGAFLARMSGCTLGASVEFWSVEDMEHWAAYNGDPFPPTNYWSKTKNPMNLRYGKSPWENYTREHMNKVPVDDDITYTLLGLLIVEDYGIHFTTEDVGKAWLKYLPMACTAEKVALDNLKKGISAMEAADVENRKCLKRWRSVVSN